MRTHTPSLLFYMSVTWISYTGRRRWLYSWALLKAFCIMPLLCTIAGCLHFSFSQKVLKDRISPCFVHLFEICLCYSQVLSNDDHKRPFCLCCPILLFLLFFLHLSHMDIDLRWCKGMRRVLVMPGCKLSPC